jgi:pSer/pThr/pTyr-binding forkhead associated (FHA) protein
MQVQLVVVNEQQNGNGQAIPVNAPSFMIGRAEGCNLRSRSSKVSRHHCTIQTNNGTVTIQDLGGDNGTFVNGNRITATQTLNDGDKLVVGTHVFIVSIKTGVAAPKSDQDFFELSPSTTAQPVSEQSGTHPADPNATTAIIQEKKPAPEAEVMFDIRLDGQRVSVTQSRLFDLARKGSILPDDLVTVAGTKVFADSIQGIVFGDKSSAPPTPPLAASPAMTGTTTSGTRPPSASAASSAPSPVTASDPFAFPELGDIAGEEHPFGDVSTGPVIRVARKESAFSALWKALDISFSRVYTIEGNDLVIHSIKALYYVLVVICGLFIFWQFFFFCKDCIDGGNFLEMLSKHSVGLSVVTFGCVTIIVIVRVLLEMLLLSWFESTKQEEQEK